MKSCLCGVRIADHVERCMRCRQAGRNQPEDEPTMEELDRIEAEQRRCLPPWWNEEPVDGSDE